MQYQGWRGQAAHGVRAWDFAELIHDRMFRPVQDDVCADEQSKVHNRVAPPAATAGKLDPIRQNKGQARTI